MEATCPPWHLLLDHPLPVRLTGTKYACGGGSCGACTVMVSKHDLMSKEIRYPAQKPRGQRRALFLCQACILISQLKKISKDLPVSWFSLSLDLRHLWKSDKSYKPSSQTMQKLIACGTQLQGSSWIFQGPSIHPRLRNSNLGLLSFYRWGNWGSKICSDLFKVIQLVSHRKRTWRAFSGSFYGSFYGWAGPILQSWVLGHVSILKLRARFQDFGCTQIHWPKKSRNCLRTQAIQHC